MHTLSRVPSRVIVVGIVAVAMFLGGCSSSQLVNMWKEPDHPQLPIDNALVVGLSKDETRRRLMEDAFVTELTRIGLTAVPSYREFTSAAPDTQQVINVVRRDGYNGVVVLVPLGTETRETYVPGYMETVPGSYYGGGYSPYGYWGGYYAPMYSTIYQPGYVERTDIVRIRIDVWSTDKNGMMVWSGMTETLNPPSLEVIRKEVIQLVVPELKRVKVIATK